MEKRRLGRSGLFVSVLGLGGNTFGRSVDATATKEIVNTALDSGVTFIDTADSYSGGRSEEFIGEALRGRRQEAILATKTGRAADNGEEGLLSRSRIITAVDESLRRLRTDYIDLLYLHRPDPATPLDETLAALDDLVHSGKVRYLGCSNHSGWELATLTGLADSNGWIPLVASQSEYSLVNRQIEDELLPAARWHGYGIVAYAPLASGFLTGKYRPGQPIPDGVRGADNRTWQEKRLTNRNFEILAAVENVATKQQRSVPEVAIAWCIAQDGVSSVLVGATSPQQVRANIAAATWILPDSEVQELNLPAR